MTINYNSNLDIGSLELDDLISQTDDAESIQELISPLLRGKSAEEIAELKERLADRFKEIEKELKELSSEYEEELSGLDRHEDSEQRARLEFKLLEIEELLQGLDETDDIALDVFNHQLLLDVKIDSNEYYFSYNTDQLNQMMDGDVITIELTGAAAQSGIFGNQGQEEDPFSPNQTTADNVDELSEFEPQMNERGAIVFVKINAGDQITSVWEEGTTKHFQITTAEGETYELVVKNVSQGGVSINFEGTGYINPALVNNFSEDLQRSSYENNNPLNFYQLIHGEDPNEIPDVEIPEAILDVDSTVSLVNGFISGSMDYAPGSTYAVEQAQLSAADAEILGSITDTLYNSNAFQLNSEVTIDQAWLEVAAQLQGLEREKQSAIMGALVTHIYKNDRANFDIFFATHKEYVKAVVKWFSGIEGKNGNAFEKMVLNILDPGFLVGMDYSQAHLSESKQALAWQRDLMQGVDLIEYTTLNNEYIQLANQEGTGGPDSISSLYGDGLHNASNAVDEYGASVARVMRESGFAAMTDVVMASLKTGVLKSLSEAESEDEFESIIENFFNAVDAAARDDLISIFIHLIHKHVPALAEVIFGNEDIRTYLEGNLHNKGAQAYGDTYVPHDGRPKEFLNGTEHSGNILDEYA